MYSTCFHCQRDLGRNEVIEHLPIGRRLAYDAAAGRIWVICPQCSRWNLVPYESRWEAIEEAERTFRATPLRASTDNVGLAKTGEGAELVRIGKPIQQELASWRYGRHFATRRRNYLTTTAPMAGALFVATQLATHLDWVPAFAAQHMPGSWQFGVSVALTALVTEARARWHLLKTQANAMLHDELVPITRRTMTDIRVVPGVDGLVQVWIPVTAGRIEDTAWFTDQLRMLTTLLPALLRWDSNRWHRPMRTTHFTTVSGTEALGALRTVLPVMNETGANERALKDSLAYLQRHNHDPAHIAFGGKRSWELAQSTPLKEFHHERRLALEMAVHADSERRWLEGDMQALLEEWRRADEIASIADGLLRDPAIEAKLDVLRDGKPVTGD